ncbi:Potential E3 ubiquitin-protein ligase ariadne-2 [Seminavis robusta]|uniref:RBR-type E3 ubiquitin transferase n=1 Tax=Seminavis robusta TaxID=568900 RepID=A0A9N8DLL4_9STRA|nr:Potential E3 ubiquitin-protein ligase ariadne-2 [Seminavis robusta]|eukprot:Sro212_g088220.1 Potential E3 ubiquitin-protein ligase ariadne-2 (498) ;mRNA; f:61118-62611
MASLDRQVQDCVEALGVPTEAAAPLLRHHQYNLQHLLQSYSDKPDQVLALAGVKHRCGTGHTGHTGTQTNDNDTEDCLICMDSLTPANSMSMPCGHVFCLDCWQDYLVNLANCEGPSFVSSTCPQQGCQEVISHTEVQTAAPLLLDKFQHYQLQSFVESNPLLKWCPGKACDCIAKAVAPHVLEEAADVHCKSCNTQFCMACPPSDTDDAVCEPHAMISCQTLQRWKAKNSNESETSNWILANTKNCPHCNSRIHKDGGCMYVTCQKCKKGFCWMCKGTHHVWQCNAYQASPAAEDDVAKAKNELERYLHYYERYHGHNKAQTFAQKQLNKLIKQELQDANGTTHSSHKKKKKKTKTKTKTKTDSTTTTDSTKSDKMDVEETEDEEEEAPPVDVRLPSLLKDANQQLVQCRRVLKYSYVFAYYHFGPQANESLKRQKETFEHHQGILEGLTEGLSKITEIKQRHKINLQDVTNRTRVIGQFIKNVLENVQTMKEMEV